MTANHARLILAAVKVHDEALEKVREANRAYSEPPTDEEAIELAETYAISLVGLETAVRLSSGGAAQEEAAEA